jgi:hypothetical protein
MAAKWTTAFGIVQFWYTEDTASTVAREAVEAAGPSGRIACIACPSLFRQLRAKYPDAHAHLFEVDLRFEVTAQRCARNVFSCRAESDICRFSSM